MWHTVIPALIMIVTTIAALTYYLPYRYVPSGNQLMIATDCILLALSLGVLALAPGRLLGFQARPVSTFSS